VSEEISFEETMADASSGNPDAMVKLADAYVRREDADSAENWYEKAAELGNVEGMYRLGDLLEARNEFQAAENWFREGAILGDSYSMYSYGFRLAERGDTDGAEDWYLKSADLGQVGAMNQLAYLLAAKGDTEGAEDWYRRSAELGSAYAMQGLGSLLKQSDPEQAEQWFREAALKGRVFSMNSLGVLLRDRGDLDEAHEWFLKAAEDGMVDAIDNLAYSFDNRGEKEAAEQWIRRATEKNSGYAWNFLGNALLARDEAVEAEDAFLRAVEFGYNDSLLTLGRMSRSRGERIEAELLFRRAAELEVPGAEEALKGLEGALRSAETMDAITFDTFGWTLTKDTEDLRGWRGKGAVLIEKYLATDFPFTSYNDEELRAEFSELMAQMNSPTFQASDLEIFEKFGIIDAEHIPKQGSLLDLKRFKLDNANCLVSISRHRMHEEVHYASSILICFAECSWLLGIELDEPELVGAREAAVARLEIDERGLGFSDGDSLDPYDPRFDGLIPIEEDPLTRIRQLTKTLIDSLRLGEVALRLDPLEVEDDE
jgi:TPR repeat protein